MPKSLQKLQFGESFDQMPYFLDTLMLHCLSALYLYYAYRHQINFDKLQSLSMIVFHKPGYAMINRMMIPMAKSLDSKKDVSNNSECEWKFYPCLYGNLMWKRKLYPPALVDHTVC